MFQSLALALGNNSFKTIVDGNGVLVGVAVGVDVGVFVRVAVAVAVAVAVLVCVGVAVDVLVGGTGVAVFVGVTGTVIGGRNAPLSAKFNCGCANGAGA